VFVFIEGSHMKTQEHSKNTTPFRAERVPALQRVAAIQLPRLSAEDRAALLPYVKRDIEQHQRTG